MNIFLISWFSSIIENPSWPTIGRKCPWFWICLSIFVFRTQLFKKNGQTYCNVPCNGSCSCLYARWESISIKTKIISYPEYLSQFNLSVNHHSIIKHGPNDSLSISSKTSLVTISLLQKLWSIFQNQGFYKTRINEWASSIFLCEHLCKVISVKQFPYRKR